MSQLLTPEQVAERAGITPEAKVDVGTLAAMMGHANLRTIQRYVHPQDEAKKEAVQNYRAAMNRKRMRRVG